MAEKVDVIGPLKGGWFAIREGGVIGQARFPDVASAWVSWREYSVRGLAALPSPKKRRIF
jgi:hypothetical protein